MDIRTVPAIPSGPQGLDALAATAAPAPVEAVSNALDPPVRVEIGTRAHGDARFVRDRDTSAMVFQVVDPGSGDVIVQSPTETVLRNRAYDAAARNHAMTAGHVARIA